MDYLALVEIEQPATEIQSQVAIKPKSFRPIEQIDLVTGVQQIIAGTWQGIGLLEPLPEQQAIWGKQVLIVEQGRDHQRLQEQFTGTMIFEPKEFLDIIEHWPETEGLVRAKRAFAGDVVGVV